MVGAILGGTLVGLISDRIGRRKAIIISLLLGVLVIPVWAYAPRAGIIIVGAFFLQFFAQGAWGVIPAHLSELAPNNLRGLLPGLAYQCGVLIAGSVGYIEAVFSEHMSYATAMAATAATVFIFTAIVAAFGKEKKGISFES